MNRLKMAGLLLIALDYSGLSLAAGRPGGTTPPPPPPPQQPAQQPQLGVITNAEPIGGSSFAFFWMNLKQISTSTAQTLATLNNQLNQIGLSACMVKTDINATPINCGNGLVKFGTNQLFSNTTAPHQTTVGLRLPRGVKTVYGTNYLSATAGGTIPGDTTGRLVDVHFNVPVTEFAMEFDPGAAPSKVNPSPTSTIDAIDFYSGVAPNKVKLGSYNLVRGVTQWVGVQDPNGITDLTIVPLGGDTNAKLFDINKLTVVTK